MMEISSNHLHPLIFKYQKRIRAIVRDGFFMRTFGYFHIPPAANFILGEQRHTKA